MPPTPCILCAHTQTTDQTCDRCVGRVRRTLIRVEQLYALLPYELAGRAGASLPMDPSGVRGNTEPMPGGDVLVMLGPGSTGWHSEVVDVDSVPGVLEKWNTDWRIALHQPAATAPATVSRCITGLLRMLTVAAQVRVCRFDEFADDMRRLHDRLELALRIGPQWSEVPCYCGGRLERPMPLPDGRAFEWRCVRCHRNYDEDQYWLAARESGQAV